MLRAISRLNLLSLSALVAQAAKDNEYLLSNRPVEFANRIDPNLSVICEPALMGIVCNNLVRNAFQYSEEGQVTVAANPNGMTLSNPYSFDSQQAEQDADFGYGLGLLILQRIADKQGWQLEICKAALEFTVTLQWSMEPGMV